MSKHIKLEDALKGLNMGYGKYDYVSKVADYYNNLPTIEVSDDAVSREAVIDIVCLDPGITSWQHKMLKELPIVIPKPKEGEWIIHKINGIPHTVECSHCHQHYDYEELRHLGRSKGCIDIPHCPDCGAKMKG